VGGDGDVDLLVRRSERRVRRGVQGAGVKGTERCRDRSHGCIDPSGTDTTIARPSTAYPW
jgi:hypothetical protein